MAEVVCIPVQKKILLYFQLENQRSFVGPLLKNEYLANTVNGRVKMLFLFVFQK